MSEKIKESEEKSSKVEEGKRAPRRRIDQNRKILGDVIIPGYHTRWINTKGAKYEHQLDDYKAAWYETVSRKELYGEGCSNPNGLLKADAADGQICVKIPDELWEEDLEADAKRDSMVIERKAEQHEGGDFSSFEQKFEHYRK